MQFSRLISHIFSKPTPSAQPAVPSSISSSEVEGLRTELANLQARANQFAEANRAWAEAFREYHKLAHTPTSQVRKRVAEFPWLQGINDVNLRKMSRLTLIHHLAGACLVKKYAVKP